MSLLAFAWSNLRRRPARLLLTLAAVTVAFLLHGLALGIAEGFRRAAMAHGVAFQPGVLFAAMGVSALGMLLILGVTISGMAHGVSVRSQELGLLKALGFSHRRIVGLLAIEAAIPCFAGLVLGLAGAKGLFAALTSALPAVAPVPAPVYTLPLAASAVMLACLVSAVATILPTRRLANESATALLRGRIAPPLPLRRRVRPSSEGPDRDTAHATRPFRDSHPAVLDLRQWRQVLVATHLALATLPLRLRGAALIVTSVTVVTTVLLAPLSMFEGIRASLFGAADPARVVLRSSATALLDDGEVPDGLAAAIADAPGVAKTTDGQPMIDAQTVIMVGKLTKRTNGKTGYTALVGVGPQWPAMTPELRLRSGRLPRPGARELIVGERALGKFSSLDADTVAIRDETWHIVGTFRTGGWWDGYLVGPRGDVKTAGDVTSDSAVRVRLSSPRAFDAFRGAVAPRLPASVLLERETDHYGAIFQRVPRALVYLTFVLATLIGAGAALAAALALDSALDERRREIATLRLLGFDAGAVAASVLLEGLVLAALGASIGTGIVWVWLDGYLYNGAWNVFRVTVDARLLCLALGWSSAIALAGGTPVALRTLRQEALDAIRSLRIALDTWWPRQNRLYTASCNT